MLPCDYMRTFVPEEAQSIPRLGDQTLGVSSVRRARRALLAFGAGIVLALTTPLVALASYPPGAFPGPAPIGAFPSVVLSQTVGTSGGTLSVASGTANITVTVPAVAFTQDTQITIYAIDTSVVGGVLPAGYRLVDGFAIGWAPVSTAALPLTLRITDPGIGTTDQVFETTASGLTPDISASVSAGSASVSFTTDPGYVVAAPSAVSTPPPSAAPTPATTLPPTSTATGGSTGSAGPGSPLLWLALVGVIGLCGLAADTWRRTRRSV